MKLLPASLLISLLLLNAPVAATFDSCSCTADDGSCSANTSCPGGCIAMCPGNGSCRAVCSKGSGSQFDLMMQVTMQKTGGNSNQVASELARITGQPVVFAPFKANDIINLDVKRAALWDVLEMLSASGKIEIGGEDFSKLQKIRNALATGEKMSVCIHNVSVRRVVEEFSSLSGLPIRIAAGDPKTMVNLSVKDVTLEEILAQLSSQSGTEISLR